MKHVYAVATIALLALASGTVAHEKVHGHLRVVHPYTVEPANGSTDTMIMMTITNTGGRRGCAPWRLDRHFRNFHHSHGK